MLQFARGVRLWGCTILCPQALGIYDLHTKTFDLDPAATLFIDDNRANVKAAQDYGWQAVLFHSADHAMFDLNEHAGAA